MNNELDKNNPLPGKSNNTQQVTVTKDWQDTVDNLAELLSDCFKTYLEQQKEKMEIEKQEIANSHQISKLSMNMSFAILVLCLGLIALFLYLDKGKDFIPVLTLVIGMNSIGQVSKFLRRNGNDTHE